MKIGKGAVVAILLVAAMGALSAVAGLFDADVASFFENQGSKYAADYRAIQTADGLTETTVITKETTTAE